MSIVSDFLARKAYLNLTYQEIADRVHKEIGTVKKQLSESSNNMTMNTAQEYAAALGGQICFMTDDALKEIKGSDLSQVRDRMRELGAINDRLRERLDEKDAEIADMEKIICKMEAEIIRKDNLIEKMIVNLMDGKRPDDEES